MQGFCVGFNGDKKKVHLLISLSLMGCFRFEVFVFLIIREIHISNKIYEINIRNFIDKN